MTLPDLGAGCLGVSREVHAQHAHDLSWLRARHARDLLVVCAAAPTTWALRAQCARDLGSGCAHSAPNPVLIQCTVYSHCLGNCSRTLFMNTVHRDYKKKCIEIFTGSTKFFKIFLGMISHMRYSYCIYYKCIDVVCEIFIFFFFRCVNSISRMCSCFRDTA